MASVLLASASPRVLLASASPRRRELLAAAGVAFQVFAPNIDETQGRRESPRAMVKRLALQKARAALDRADALGLKIVLAADTTVAIGARVLGKPRDDADAARMLRALSGRVHEVHTGFCVLHEGRRRALRVVTTAVAFRRLAAADIRRYVASGEHRDKAGAYAIQGAGGALVASLRGSYTNVVGLPLAEVLVALAAGKT